jgi:hypothetical protein
LQIYATFNVSVTEEDSPQLIIRRSNGCLLSPFYGWLNPDQIYSLEVLDIPIAVSPVCPRDTEKSCMNPQCYDGAQDPWDMPPLLLTEIDQIWAAVILKKFLINIFEVLGPNLLKLLTMSAHSILKLYTLHESHFSQNLSPNYIVYITLRERVILNYMVEEL